MSEIFVLNQNFAVFFLQTLPRGNQSLAKCAYLTLKCFVCKIIVVVLGDTRQCHPPKNRSPSWLIKRKTVVDTNRATQISWDPHNKPQSTNTKHTLSYITLFVLVLSHRHKNFWQPKTTTTTVNSPESCTCMFFHEESTILLVCWSRLWSRLLNDHLQSVQQGCWSLMPGLPSKMCFFESAGFTTLCGWMRCLVVEQESLFWFRELRSLVAWRKHLLENGWQG